MATIRDVARMAGVSVSTVSLVLHQPHRVSEPTTARVLQAVDALRYRPNGAARDLRIRKTHTIAVFLRDLSGPFYSELIAAVERATSALGLTLIVSGRSTDHRQGSLRLLREGRVDGAIVLDPEISWAELAAYSGPHLPVVVLNRMLPAPLESAYLTAVAVDNEGGGYLAGRHLLERGFVHPAFIAGPVGSETSQWRQQGFFRAYEEAGISPTRVAVVHSDFTEPGGIQAMDALMARRVAMDAVFAANDEMALGAMQVLTAPKSPPVRVAVMGFDDIRLARYVRPTLSTIHQPMDELGTLAMDLLARAMGGETRVPPRVLTTTLVVRESTTLLHPT